MVLESTVVCVDGSDYMRNGDFVPTRLQAQQDAISMVTHAKLRQNPENNVALIVCRDRAEVLTTLTTDVGKILSKAHQIQPEGSFTFGTGICVAHLALKHRIGKSHRMRIVAFVGSPILDDEKELVKLAKRLKKEKVSVDVVNFGNEADNDKKLQVFIETLNGKEGQLSHLVNIPTGPMLTEPLVQSAVLVGEDGQVPPGFGAGGSGMEFGFDANEDPELAMALRISLEEQRMRQGGGQTGPAPAESAGLPEQGQSASGGAPPALSDEEAMLNRALAMSMEQQREKSGKKEPSAPGPAVADEWLSEEEQLQRALALSMEAAEQSAGLSGGASAMDVDSGGASGSSMPHDTAALLSDPAYVSELVRSLPGVNPDSQEIKAAISTIQQQQQKKTEEEEKPKKRKTTDKKGGSSEGNK